MNSKLCRSALLSGALLLTAGMAAAQENAPAPRMRGPEGGGFGAMQGDIEVLGFGGAHGGKVVTGAPFSATAVSQSTQTLGDGNHITRKTQVNLFRDGQGRFRKEVSFSGTGPLAAGGQARSFVVIQDPVAKKGFVLMPDQKIARTMGGKGMGGKMGHRGQHPQATPQDGVKTESLGTQKINGVTAEGTRVTETIPAGVIGNESPVTIVSEKWYSSELQMTVMSKRTDPRFGETTYNLTNIQRTEPDTSLFTVPQDYTIKEGGPRMNKFRGTAPAPNTAPPAEN